MADRVNAAKERSLAKRLTPLDISELVEGAVCDICQQPLVRPPLYEFPFITPCGHVFGNHCIMKWLAGGNEINDCPICRQSVLKRLTDEEAEQRALLEELDMHGPREPIPDDPSTWNGRLKAVLSDSGRDWAVKAEELWKTFLTDLIVSLEDMTTAEEWLSGHVVTVRRCLRLATVEGFYKLVSSETANGPIGTRAVFGISDPKARFPGSYQTLCEHLDQSLECATVVAPHKQSFGKPRFLEADDDLYSFLIDCHRKLAARYKKVNGDLTVAYKKAWP